MIFIIIFFLSSADKKNSSLLNENEVANREHAWQMINERKKRDDKKDREKKKQIYRQQLINGESENKNCYIRSLRVQENERKGATKLSKQANEQTRDAVRILLIELNFK